MHGQVFFKLVQTVSLLCKSSNCVLGDLADRSIVVHAGHMPNYVNFLFFKDGIAVSWRS